MNTLEKIITLPTKKVEDPRGNIYSLIRTDSKYYIDFGETFVSVIHPENYKAWKMHESKSSYLSVIRGSLQIVFYDEKNSTPENQLFKQLDLSEENYKVIIIPPQLWYGIKCTSNDSAYILETTTEPHDEAKVHRRLASHATGIHPDIPYQWN